MRRIEVQTIGLAETILAVSHGLRHHCLDVSLIYLAATIRHVYAGTMRIQARMDGTPASA